MALKFRRPKRPAKSAPAARAPERNTAWAYGSQYRACLLEQAPLELRLGKGVRAHDGACVSTPIGWDEVTPALDPSKFNLRTLPARLEAKGELFSPVLDRRVQLGPVLARMGLG